MPVTSQPAQAKKPAEPKPVGGPRMPGGRRRWLLAIGLGIAVHVGAFFLIRVPAPDRGGADGVGSRAEWLGANASRPESAVGEQLYLFDLEPLYFPTRWNYGADEVGLFEGGRSPADAFDFYPGRFLVPEGQPPGRLVPQLPVIGGPGEALSLFRWHFLTAFGRVDRERVALGERRGVIEVRRVIGGEALLEQEVPGSPGPEWPDWRPFEMLVLVGKDGVIGEPLVVPVGPGTAAVEGFFRRYVRTGLRLDLRVGPGYYRILIGP